MSKIFKPRRGSATTMNGSKASTVLAEGELFFEYPSTGVGTGECKIKLGDGSTAYSSLPYAIDGTAISSKKVTVTSNSSSTITAALNNVATGKTLGVIVGALKQAVSLCNTSITALNDETTTMKSNFQAGVNTVYNAVVAKGVTPASKTPSAIATAIGNISSSVHKLTVTKMVCTTHTMNYNGSSIAPGNNIPALFNGITGDWGSITPNPIVYTLGTYLQTHTFTVTFNKKVSTITSIRDYICTGAGVQQFWMFLYNGNWYTAASNSLWSSLINISDFPTGISVNSNTFTFSCRANSEHSGTSEFEFYGI